MNHNTQLHSASSNQ